MAFSLLSQFNPDRKTVSSISLNKRGERWIAAVGVNAGTVSDLQPLPDGKGMSFTHLSPSLPWGMPKTGSAETLQWERVHPAAAPLARHYGVRCVPPPVPRKTKK